jgi:porin
MYVHRGASKKKRDLVDEALTDQTPSIYQMRISIICIKKVGLMKCCLLLAACLSAGATFAFAQTDTGLLGDAGGARTALGRLGITFSLQDSENFLGNLSGGVKQGDTLQGVATAAVQLDTGAAFGLPGGTFNISALQIHGRSLSAFYLDDLQAANGNEAEDGTRLWELWYDQQFLHNKFDVKIGQQSIDNEFITSTNSGLFVNTAAGWPLLPSDDMFGGGPAYPLSSLGLRLRAEPNASTTILAGVFDDNPGGGAFTQDAQALDADGTRFSLNTGALFIAEVQVTAKPAGLPGTYKLGAWYDTGDVPDQEYGTDGLPLGAADSNGTPALRRGNYALYGVMDQTIWQSAGARAVNVFARVMGGPDQQNLIDFACNGGVTFAAPLPGRANDLAGIDVDFGRVSPRAAAADLAAGLRPRVSEALVELTYQAQATSWLIVQPTLQYVINPGAGIADPDDAAKRLSNEFTAGVRAVIFF